MAEPDKRPVTWEELSCLKPAQADAPAKLLIEEGAYYARRVHAEALRRTDYVSKTLQSHAAMNIADILIWEATNGLLLIPAVIAMLMLTRWIRGRPVFTERDWLFLIGHPREKVLSVHLWLRFAMLWFAVVLIGFVEGYVLLPFALASFLGAVFLSALVVWRVAPKWLS